jgi:hypothetical protein
MNACAIAMMSMATSVIACSDDELTKVLPQIAVEPEMIDFGDGIVDQENAAVLLVKNQGSGNLEISGFDFENAGEPVFSIRDAVMFVQPTDEEEQKVIFVPRMAHAVYESTMIIHSNDPKNPALRVPLKGVGGVREIEVTPLSIDFGTVNEGTAPRRAITVANIGKDPLLVSSITFTSTSVDLLLAPNTFREGTLLPGTSTVVEMVYSPVDLGADFGTVVIASNDEDEPDVEVFVEGNANLAPRAIAWGCNKPLTPGSAGCDGVEKVRSITAGFRRLIGIDGRDTYDPEGGAITRFRWEKVVAPPMSSAIFHSTDDINIRKRSTGDIEIVRVGLYDLRLIATDERGLDSLDREESHVLISPRDLELLLRWDLATDVDLHVVRPDGVLGDYGTGRVGTSTGSDCSAFNRYPNWADLSTSSDDPSLDKDDVTGRGPEIVSLDSPIDGGEYAVVAHYCDSRRVTIPVGVTIEVYVRGELIGSVPSASSTYQLASGEAWEGARVIWHEDGPTAEIIDQSNMLPIAAPELCLSR